jgi:spore maturation protein CgeB
MSAAPLRIAILGLSITSAWGNGHATTWRALVRALARRGHEVTFLERDVPWYAANRDLSEPPFCRTFLYRSLDELRTGFARLLREADVVILGSFVPEGVAVGGLALETARGLVAFYDIDTPVTLAALARGEEVYLSPALIPRFDLYLSFTGGPTLARLEKAYGARMARPLYCAVDPDLHFPDRAPAEIDLGYLGTYSADRQEKLDALLIGPARAWPGGRFAVAGPQYPDDIGWPENVARTEHLPPAAHRDFYNRQRYTLNLTRADMAEAGFSPSVRLFEAAACGTPIISDAWPGIETLFRPGEEVLLARTGDEVLTYLQHIPDDRRRALGAAARERVLAAHTADHRAAELEAHIAEAAERRVRERPASRLEPSGS